MAKVEIKGTFNIPTKNKLWLVKLTGVNRKKFSGKRGYVLESKQQDYYRAEHYYYDNIYCITAIDNLNEENATCIYEKIKMFDMTEDDVSFQFSFFGHEIGAKTLKELKKKVSDKLNQCNEHIEKAKKAKTSLEGLSNQLRKVS